MNVIHPNMKEVVESLLLQLRPNDCIDAEEWRLAQELQALPIGFSLWAYVFLKPDGEVLSTGWEPGELDRSTRNQDILQTLAWGGERYPQLAALIPARPPEAIDCRLWRHRINASGS
jgi:hypothetical protein